MMKMMMMADNSKRATHHINPTVHVPPWSHLDDPTVSAEAVALAAALQRYATVASGDDDSDDSSDLLVDAFSTDDFRMYEFKIRRCSRARSHDWTECPFAHPGEKAHRRDTRRFHYSGVPCPDFRKGSCRRGDACEYAHGVFECWLHPSRYRTQPCKDGTACRRRVCFFAHTPEQLRLLSGGPKSPVAGSAVESYDGSPMRQQGMEAYLKAFLSSPMSPPLSPTADSSPVSPIGGSAWPERCSASEISRSLRRIQLSKAKSAPVGVSWLGNGVFGSPRSPATAMAGFNGGFYSLPSTPSGAGVGWFEEEALPAERVESGRALRAKMFEKLSRDGGAGGAVEVPAGEAQAPDVAWISELVM